MTHPQIDYDRVWMMGQSEHTSPMYLSVSIVSLFAFRAVFVWSQSGALTRPRWQPGFMLAVSLCPTTSSAPGGAVTPHHRSPFACHMVATVVTRCLDDRVSQGETPCCVACRRGCSVSCRDVYWRSRPETEVVVET